MVNVISNSFEQMCLMEYDEEEREKNFMNQ